MFSPSLANVKAAVRGIPYVLNEIVAVGQIRRYWVLDRWRSLGVSNAGDFDKCALPEKMIPCARNGCTGTRLMAYSMWTLRWPQGIGESSHGRHADFYASSAQRMQLRFDWKKNFDILAQSPEVRCSFTEPKLLF